MSANHTTVVSTKNVGLAILLTVLFGPLGMLYATIPGAIIMIIVTFVVGVVTVGLGYLITWPVCIIWAAVAANSYNKQIMG